MWKQYNYIEHSIQGMQDFVTYLFLDVLFRAPEYPNSDLMDVVNDSTKALLQKVKDFKFYEQFKTLFEDMKTFDKERIDKLRTAFELNNQIERLCRNEIVPFRFKDLQKEYKADTVWNEFLSRLKTFCNDLYEKHIKLSAFQEKFGTLGDYYKALVRNDSTCHCCGIGEILTEDNTPRDPFDHYLPKGIYPFVSLNFHNLVPACPHCNSSYKKEADTLFVKQGRTEKQVKAFSPFANEEDSSCNIHVEIEMLSSYKMEKTKFEDINVICSCPEHKEECENWMRIYKIKEQYTSFCHRLDNLCLINDMIIQNFSSPDYARNEIQKMERNLNIHRYFLLAPFARAVFKSLDLVV